MYDEHILANMLWEQAMLCGVGTTRGRCLRVIRNHPGITDEMSLLSEIPALIQESAQVSSLCAQGVQQKEWVNGTLYKWDSIGGHPCGLVEHVVSRALDYVTIDTNTVPHIRYDAVSDGYRCGCKCASYRGLGDSDLEFVYFKEAYSLETLASSGLFIPHLRTIATWFLIDAMFYNEDRHLGNLLFVKHRDGSLDIPPIFDMGNALSFLELPNYRAYEPNPYLMEQVRWARGVVGDRALQFRIMDFYNEFDRTSPYPREKVDVIIERVLRCSEDYFVQSFVEVV